MTSTVGLRRAAPVVTLCLLAGCAAVPRPSATGPSTPAASPAAAGGAPVAGALPSKPHAVAVAPAVAPPVRSEARVTLAAVGDVLMHDAVKRAAEARRADAPDAGYAWLFAPVADLLGAADLTFANLETPIAPQASQGSRAFVFNAPPAVIAALQRAGVDLVAVANNHAMDQGRRGFEETLRWLRAAGLPYVGAGPAPRAAGPVRIERNGLALAFLGYTYGLNQDGNACPPAAARCEQVAEVDRARMVEDVRAAAASADAVIVSVHWGVEYQQAPRADEVDLAHRLADAGALVVLGHHPHVLQPVELYRRADGRTAVIAYSLGNFVSNQSRNYVAGVTPDAVAATRDGALLRVSLARRDYGRGVEEVEVAGADYLPLWTENDTVEIDRRKEPARRPAIRVVAVDRALASVRAELAALPDPLPDGERTRYVALRRREELYLARRAAVAGVMGEDLLRTLGPAELAGTDAPAPSAPAPAPSARAPGPAPATPSAAP
ncbi:putative enzyme of poly-gamma-glutamate biosynthesis (capsule formation)-like protein [Anaeromyxobacter dehalogenans 2CP-1]|uniref:Enzyme of poly-gamma-glutamate biosynthesis (Capsule formation)-like protein n=1 Tax=Anaeromyxobacter dehalogenans (strain ATCC BAA-258 / DSM 21875 / 2CP-1) TaxID=455488 RepID=B8JBB1_ANAD2|nr:putative enzyme of poly-gamma-glutamate biosynthesis (capsule formation)-like protein [Anaeromyxobacter dehalogenans 2CP-1]